MMDAVELNNVTQSGHAVERRQSTYKQIRAGTENVLTLLPYFTGTLIKSLLSAKS